jgi:citryl-CoA lyase
LTSGENDDARRTFEVSENQRNKWNTELAGAFQKPDRILLRGYDIQEMMQNLTFTEAFYIYLTGEVPTKRAVRMFDCLLIESMDYSPMAPAVTAARIAASQGASLHSCLASALLTHGGDLYGGRAGTLLPRLYEGLRRVREDGLTMDEAAEEIVARNLEEYPDVDLAVQGASRGFPMMGHKFFEEYDPRAQQHLRVAEELGFAGANVQLVVAMGEAFHRLTGRKIIVGGPAVRMAVLLDMGLNPRFSTIINETASMGRFALHALEEQSREGPRSKYLTADDVSYDGPSQRPLPAIT